MKENPDIKTIFNIDGGNAGLTEEFIYQNQPMTKEEAIPILSSATIQTNLMGIVSRNAKIEKRSLKIFSSPAILVTRNGFAGQMTYIDESEFTTNDHAYVMTVKPEWKDKVNLRWFTSQYQELFKNLVTSKSDNATFSKEYAEKQKVIIPDITIQNTIADKLCRIDELIKELDDLKKQATSLTQSKISFS